MFNGINFRTLFSSPGEWHSFVIGFCEVLCPWPARCYIPKEQRDKVLAEYHYYSAGRGAGFIALLCVILLFSWLIKEALL